MLSFTNILNRQDIAKSIKEHVINFDKLDDNIDNKKGLYVYGSPGCGKTHFVVWNCRLCKFWVQALRTHSHSEERDKQWL